MKSYEQATEGVSTVDRLDQIRMSPGERRAALASLHQGELLADMLLRASDDLRRAFALIARGVHAGARRSKLSPATPEWRLP